MQKQRDGTASRVQPGVLLDKHFTNPDLQGRMDAYELAYRMQAEVPGVLDLAERDGTKR